MQTAALADSLVNLAKRVADSQPEVNFCFGKVVQESPLLIMVEQRLLVPEDELILTDSVIAFVERRQDDERYLHDKIYSVYHDLTLNDRVLLARVQGGQAYVIVSRYYATELDEEMKQGGVGNE